MQMGRGRIRPQVNGSTICVGRFIKTTELVPDCPEIVMSGGVLGIIRKQFLKSGFGLAWLEVLEQQSASLFEQVVVARGFLESLLQLGTGELHIAGSDEHMASQPTCNTV